MYMARASSISIMTPSRLVPEDSETSFLNQSKNKNHSEVSKFQIYSLRSSPITAHRLIASIKDILSGCTHVPVNLEVSQKNLQYMSQAYSKQLVNGGKPRCNFTREGSMKNLLELLQGAEIDKLRAYMLSSFFTFGYFLKKYRDNNTEMIDAYNKIRNGKAPSNTQISAVANVIVESGEKVNEERLRGVFRRSIEMKKLFNKYQGFLDEITEEDEACMKYYFRCFEIETPIEQPEDKFVIFKNREGVPLYVRGRELLTLAEIDAREATRIRWEQNVRDNKDDDKNDENEEVVNMEEAKNKYEINDNWDDEDNFEESYIKNSEDNFEESDIEDEDNFESNNVGDDEYPVENDNNRYNKEKFIESKNTENLMITFDKGNLQTRTRSILKSSTTAIYKSFEKYFDNERRSDAKFVFFDGRCIHAHAIILENKSNAFADWLPTDVSVTSPVIVNVQDIDYEVMYETIRYIYMGKIYDLDKFAAQFLEPAKRFLLEDLTVLCEKHLCEKLSIGNVVDLLVLAENYNLRILKEKAMNIVATNLKDIVHLAKFEYLMTHYPKVALEIVRCSSTK